MMATKKRRRSAARARPEALLGEAAAPGRLQTEPRRTPAQPSDRTDAARQVPAAQPHGSGALAELAESIKAQGLIQPIVVRAAVGAATARDRYEIIAGERRWRAAQLAGLARCRWWCARATTAAVAMALIENIQREDLNPLEEALALQRLIDEFDLTHQQAAEAVGRSRAAVSNLLRLLELTSLDELDGIIAHIQ
jgi:ParB family chromosome partitioning protein